MQKPPQQRGLLLISKNWRAGGWCVHCSRRRGIFGWPVPACVGGFLLKTALAAGHRAKYVLFDSWFSNPKQLLDIKKLGLNTIAMVKRSSKRFYIFEGKSMDNTVFKELLVFSMWEV